MACFVAPVTEAVIVTVMKHNCRKQEEKTFKSAGNSAKKTKKVTFSQKLGWLNTMLWGGSFLLVIEHIWHGEVVPWFPFLTAMMNPADIPKMLMEIASVGTTMAVIVTLIWGLIVLAYNTIEKKANAPLLSDKNAEGV
ncbi:MAG: hypothetical protein E6600_13295 [Anaerocolumna aminovalerica]|uniref:hypothetical protein n=1 Tax=Anaerocolumna aminovalerica TaxID=1527 RepID=UPI002905F96A|nr:hypothetical protein [Anaerocolumna aminovalerica]MDU6265467.1 hypothetical protein [Anaerocolumna aminovalerica]